MKNMDSAGKAIPLNRTVVAFISLGICAWVIDSVVDAAFFYGDSLPTQMFAANAENIWSRLFILGIFVLFGSYAGLIISRGNRAKDDALQARQFAETVFNSMHDSISVVDAATYKIIDVNTVFLSDMGLTREEVIGKTCYELIGRQTEPCTPTEGACPLRETVRSGSYASCEQTLFNSRGKKILAEVSTSPIFNSSGQVAQVVHVVKNITEQKRMETEMQKLSMVVEKTADMVVITSKGGIIEYVNPAFEELTGYSRKEALGCTPRILKSGEHDYAFYENMWETILAGNVFRDVFINRKKDGTIYYDACTITPVINTRGEITNFIATAKDITEQKRYEQELRDRAEKDYLTGIFNRRTFFEILERELDRVRRYGRPLSLVMLDIDHFKKINDTHGHAVGDTVLKETSRIVQKNIRHTDVFARIGGEEFVILAPESTLRHTISLAEKVRAAMAQASMLPNGEKVTISFGVTELAPSVSTDEFMKQADDALYLAKENGRDRVEYYQPTMANKGDASSIDNPLTPLQ